MAVLILSEPTLDDDIHVVFKPSLVGRTFTAGCFPSLSLTTKNWRITSVNANKIQTVNACEHVQADEHYTYSLNNNNNHSRDESTRNLANILSFKFESHETRVTRIRHATPRNFM